jgi:hypothetical protein
MEFVFAKPCVIASSITDMEDLKRQLDEAKAAGAKQIIIVTDGAFSMDGTIAQLDKICDLADRYEACGHDGRVARNGVHRENRSWAFPSTVA